MNSKYLSLPKTKSTSKRISTVQRNKKSESDKQFISSITVQWAALVSESSPTFVST